MGELFEFLAELFGEFFVNAFSLYPLFSKGAPRKGLRVLFEILAALAWIALVAGLILLFTGSLPIFAWCLIGFSVIYIATWALLKFTR